MDNMNEKEEKLYMYTDETGIPYEDYENPFPSTEEDHERYILIAKELGIILDDEIVSNDI